jgi:outer membrane lipoprotein SlyB
MNSLSNSMVPSSVLPLVVGSAAIGGIAGGVVGGAVGGAVAYSTGNYPAGKLVILVNVDDIDS